MRLFFNNSRFSFFVGCIICLLLTACGGGGSGTSSGNNSGGGSSGGTGGGGNTTRSGSNVVPITVDSSVFNVPNEPFIAVTICSPTNPSICMTVDHILVDTGSVGLRIFNQPANSSTTLSSTLNLPPATASGNPIGECLQFVQGNTWGPLKLGNIKIGGETASNVALQIINDANFIAAPSACTSSGTLMNTPTDFGANGVLGIGTSLQDCGSTCTQPGSGIYFICIQNSNTCTDTGMLLASQIQNPVSTFGTDNNGVIVSFNAVSSIGDVSATGTLTFGIDTQTNNASKNLNTLIVDSYYGTFTTTFEGQTYQDSYIDSGSNGLFFNSPNSITQCPGNSNGFYCPNSNLNLTAQLSGLTGSTPAVSVAFNVGNGNNLTGYALNNLAGTATDVPGLGKTFDWGLPFFFGRDVYFVIEGAHTTKQAGPYVGF